MLSTRGGVTIAAMDGQGAYLMHGRAALPPITLYKRNTFSLALA